VPTRSLRLAVIWFTAIALATGAAYFSVTASLQRNREPSQARQQLEDTRRAARYADDLSGLLQQIAGRRPSPAPRLTGPMLAELRAKVRQSQQEILRTHLSGPTYNALLATADRLAACATEPQNEALRTAAHRAQDDLDFLVKNEIKRLQSAVERDRRP